MNNRGWTIRSILLLSVLPSVHLCACATVLVSRSLHFMLIADFPVSGLFLVLAWRFGHPLLWFVILGTAWWYLLAWMLGEIVRITTDSRY
jgi:hypothetical protein